MLLLHHARVVGVVVECLHQESHLELRFRRAASCCWTMEA